MNEIIRIDYDGAEPCVSGRELHEWLGVKEKYADWIIRMIDFGFEEGTDFFREIGKTPIGRPSSDHMLTIDMAKEISMIQRTPKGKQAREYFIAVEKAWKDPGMIKARAEQLEPDDDFTILCKAVLIGDKKMKAQQEYIELLEPKAQYYDAVMNVNGLTNLRDAAKIIGIGEKELVNKLIADEFCRRLGEGKNNKWMPYAKYCENGRGYFVLKECLSSTGGGSFIQPMFTAKGRHFFGGYTQTNSYP